MDIAVTWVDHQNWASKYLSSIEYNIWYQTDIVIDIQTGTRNLHFRNANEKLDNVKQKNPDLTNMLPKEIVGNIQPSLRDKFKSTSPTEYSWHHNAYELTI